MPLGGRTILVSGGSARVADVAPALAAGGARLVLHAVADQVAAAERTADAIRASGASIDVLRAPLHSVADAERLAAVVCGGDAALCGLVSAPLAPLEGSGAFDAAGWEAALTVSLKLPFFLARAAARRLADMHGGAIIHVIEGGASSMSRVAGAGLIAMTHALAKSLPASVRAAAVVLPHAPAPVPQLGALVAALLTTDSLPSGTVIRLGSDDLE